MKCRQVKEKQVGLVAMERGGQAFGRTVQCGVYPEAVLVLGSPVRAPCLGCPGCLSRASAVSSSSPREALCDLGVDRCTHVVVGHHSFVHLLSKEGLRHTPGHHRTSVDCRETERVMRPCSFSPRETETHTHSNLGANSS